LNQKVMSAELNRFAIEGSVTTKAQEFAVSDIVSINPPVKPIPRWTGDISAGLTITHGNTETETVSASANFTKRTENDRTTINADYAKGKLYAYVDGRYEKDAVAELDRRMIVGVGAGYQWIESEDMNFSSEFGLASLYEKFDNQTDSNSEISLQVGYNFDMKLRDNIKFVHDLTYYPSIDKFSNYFLTTTAGIRADLTETFFATFKTIFNHDSTPAIGAHKSDIKYFFGLGYRF